ncbi:TonB-dependent siderophore receptor [Sphingobacterium bovistauri]|uniref:TonB-dependent siderophore receptor n=1 Tax=Sphingobacterium bovistauri TaxID=2781959 RepID=A0ABS7Z9C0_9SPHI|nr:TonB-dependent siderophore receptor [Sphingobacterium bovistauri]MCA5006793.1 TonB-dependent siderophore receptor [Sphingobacterium bovistauri]
MKTKIFYALLVTMSIGSIAYAQTTIKGKLVDNQGKELPNITISTGNKQAQSDSKGNFQLFIPQNGAFDIIVSGLGYRKEMLKINPAGAITELKSIVLHKFDREIEQVEVVGYNSINNKKVGVAKSGIDNKDLPQSVQIINKQVIEDQQINTLGDALKNANGIALGANRGAVGENFFARGYSLGANNIFKNGSRTNNGGRIEASTLESIEILKGSAALLYGGVTGGAVVNLVTKKPQFHTGAEISFRYGSWDTYKPTLDVYGPLSNKVAFRFVGTGESANNYRDVVKTDRVYINPSVLYKISDRTELSFNFDYLKSDYTPDFGIGSVEGKINNEVERNTFLNVNGAFNNTNSTNGQVAFDHNFNEDWKLSLIAGIQNYNRNYYGSERIQANAQGLAPRALSRSATEEFTKNQQLNLTGNFLTGGIKHQLLFGGDMDQSATKAYAYNIFADLSKPTTASTAYDQINVLNPIPTRSDIPSSNKNTWTKTDVYRYGAFIQDLVSLSEKFKVLAGVRYTYQRTPYSEKYTYKTGVKEDVKNMINGKEAGAKIDKAWSPKFALIYQPLTSSSIYISYANNFITNTGYDINFQPLTPSLVDHFEAGIKNDFYGGRFSANLTAYRINNNKFTQMALITADGSANGDTNMKEFTGKTSSDGIELDVNGNILPGLNILAGYAYNFMRYSETLGIIKYKDSAGKDAETSGSEEDVRLVGTTAHTGNATLFYTFHNGSLKGLKLGTSAFYTGKRNAGWNNSKINERDGVNRLIPVDPFTTFDISLGYSAKKFSILAKMANITDELSYFIHENYSVNPIPPRNFMTTISYKF